MLSIIFPTFCMICYSNLPEHTSGIGYFPEFLMCLGAILLFSSTLAITFFIKTTTHLIEKKHQGKNYFPKILLVISILIFAFGIYVFIINFKHNINIGKTNATIVYYAENEFGYKLPIVKYIIDEKTYKVMISVLNDELRNSSLNDVVKIYYNKNNPSKLDSPSKAETIYIPCLIISCLFIFISIKKGAK